MADDKAATHPVVTLSAPFGSGGSRIGPAVAERLQIPFVDRAIPASVAAELHLAPNEALDRDGVAPHGFARLIAAFARIPTGPLGPVEGVAGVEVASDEQYVEATEATIRQLAGSGAGAVFLGRAAAVVLAEHPGAVHVRLTGEREARLRAAVEHEGISLEDARGMQRRTDGARAAYVRSFYGRDPDDVALYHLVIDSVRLPEAVVVELIATLATRVAASPSGQRSSAR